MVAFTWDSWKADRHAMHHFTLHHMVPCCTGRQLQMSAQQLNSTKLTLLVQPHVVAGMWLYKNKTSAIKDESNRSTGYKQQSDCFND